MTYIREASSKMYSPVVFALSQLAAEMPYSILCSVMFFLLICTSFHSLGHLARAILVSSKYFMPVASDEERCTAEHDADARRLAAPPADYPVGFNMDSSRAGYGFAMSLLTELFAVTMCVLVRLELVLRER
jgi:hypothetical protein